MNGLALVEGIDHVCCRYRLRAFLEDCSRLGVSVEIEPIGSRLGDRLRRFASVGRFDFVFLQRKLPPVWQTRLLAKRSKRLIFDFDDAVVYRDSNDPRGPGCPRRARRFAAVVRASDLVLAGNAFLADLAEDAGAREVRVFPTCLDVDRYRPRPRADSANDRGLTLVWIGSSSTLQFLERKRDLWKRVGEELPGTRFKIVCDRFPRFDGIAVEPVPWSEAIEASALSGSDVGVAWVPDDLWSRGKCGLKVLQYQAAGLPAVAAPVGVHREMIEPGVSGFLPETDDDWIAAFRRLRQDPALRERQGIAARRSVENRYATRRWSERFAEALIGPPKSSARSSSADSASTVAGRRSSESKRRDRSPFPCRSSRAH